MRPRLLLVGAIAALLAVGVVAYPQIGTSVDKNELRAALESSKLVQSYTERDVGDGFTLFKGTAQGTRGVRVQFALLAGSEAVGQTRRRLLEDVSTSEASSPNGSRYMLFLTNASAIDGRGRRNAAYDTSIDLEQEIFATVAD